MPSSEQIAQTVTRIVAEQFGVDAADVRRDMTLTEDLNGDSLDMVELVMELEDEFTLIISDEEAEKVQTVGQAIDAICAELGVEPPGR